MRDKVCFWGGFLGIVLYIGHLIYQKEQVIRHGTEFLLKLAHKDPRSMMQGDYMRLEYHLTRQIDRQKNSQRQGSVTVYLDKNKVASLKPSQSATSLSLPFQQRRGRSQIGPNAFFIQEGNDALYKNAAYGVFRTNNQGQVVLIALADDKRKIIQSPPKP